MPQAVRRAAQVAERMAAERLPAVTAVRRAAQAVERLAATAREELPGTMAAVRLSGMEISDLTMELSDLSHEISQGVRSPARASRLSTSTSAAKAKEQHAADALRDATVIPIRVVSPLFSTAAGVVGAAASTVTSTVGSTVSHVGGTVGAAASHVGGTVGAAASHVGGAASHIPSVVFNLVDFLPWGQRRGDGEGGEGGGRVEGKGAEIQQTSILLLLLLVLLLLLPLLLVLLVLPLLLLLLPQPKQQLVVVLVLLLLLLPVLLRHALRVQDHALPPNPKPILRVGLKPCRVHMGGCVRRLMPLSQLSWLSRLTSPTRLQVQGRGATW
ncbi:hypothetical protein CLOP_g11402 [Closterium sp. NIES-67]|nr:hypothetical protein CLOP_g11402 [Closterium sp. NIES-67]